MGWRRLLKYALVTAAVLLSAATIALWNYIAREASGPELKPRIETALAEFLGRPVTIESVGWRPWPDAMLVGKNVRLYEDPLKTRLMVDAPVVEARLSVLSLRRFAAGVTELRFISPRISLRRAKDGVWNAEKLADEISACPDQPGPQWGSLAFNWFAVEGGTVTVEDAAGDLAQFSPLEIKGRGKLRFGRRHVHFPFELDVRSESSAAKVLLAGDLGGHTRLRVDVKGGEPALARLAWPPAAQWTGLWDGTFNYDERRKAPWLLNVRAAPLLISTTMPTFDSLEATGEYYSPSSATFAGSARSARTELAAKGATENGALARLNVDVKNGEASLAGLAWPPAAHWRGRWEGSLAYDERPPVRWRLRVRAEDLAVSTSAPKLDLLEATGDYLSSSSSTFTGLAKSSTTEIEVKGSAIKDSLVLDVKSPRADLDTLLAFARAAAAAAKRVKSLKKAPAAAAWPKSLTATISADDLRYGSADLRGVRAVVRRSKGPYTLEGLTFQTLGGAIAASGSYLPSTADDALHFSWKTSGVDIPDLFRMLGSTRDAGGVADSEGHLVTGLGDRFLPAMSGTVKLDIKNGWTAMPGLLKVLSRLNLTTLFAEALGHHRQRLPYDEAHASVTIAKGKVTTDKPIMLQNKTFQMAFLGSYDLPSRAVDGRIVVNFLTVTDEIIRLIPGVRDILLGKEKGLMPIWVEVKGRGDDPEIKVLSARTISGPVWNTFKHILRLPKTLFNEIKPPKDPPKP